MSMAWRVCPHCGVSLPRKLVQFSAPFECPACSTKLRIRQTAYNLRVLVLVFLSPLVMWMLGFRGLVLVIFSVLAFVVLCFLTRLLVNAVYPPKVIVRPEDDATTNHCPKCGTELEKKYELKKPFSCPTCGVRLQIVMGRGAWLFAGLVAFWLFVAIPLAALIGYEFGVRGVNLGLLPLATFLVGSVCFGLIMRFAKTRIQTIRVELLPAVEPVPDPSQQANS